MPDALRFVVVRASFDQFTITCERCLTSDTVYSTWINTWIYQHEQLACEPAVA